MNDKETAALIERIRSGIQKQIRTEEQVLQLNMIQDSVNKKTFDTLLYKKLKGGKNERQENNPKINSPTAKDANAGTL